MGGFYGEVSERDCVGDVYHGTDYHSHLGTKFGGMAVFDGKEIKRDIKNISEEYFRPKLKPFVQRTSGKMGIGIISDYEEQPLGSHSHGGYFAVHVGRIDNLDDIVRQEEEKRNATFTELIEGKVNPVELVIYLIDREKDFTKGIENVQDRVEGSSSLLLLTKEGIYATRDRLGRTPVVIGRRKKDGALAVTSETCAFPNLVVDRDDPEEPGFEIERYMGPGEIARITPEGYEILKQPGEDMQICSFLWVYYGFPASSYEDIGVELMRNRSGAIQAKIDKQEDSTFDFVAGIPDSGTGHAIGYENEMGIPYMRPFVKYTQSWGRSFMPQEQEVRDLVAIMKLIPIKELIQGKKILFCEDSIVRGTQLRNIIRRLFSFGADEIHMRPACPPLKYPCKFLNFSRSYSPLDLAGRKVIAELEGENADVSKYIDENSEHYERMVDRVEQRIGLTGLRYQRLDDMVSAIGLPKEKLCTYCWDGCGGCK